MIIMFICVQISLSNVCFASNAESDPTQCLVDQMFSKLQFLEDDTNMCVSDEYAIDLDFWVSVSCISSMSRLFML